MHYLLNGLNVLTYSVTDTPNRTVALLAYISLATSQIKTLINCAYIYFTEICQTHHTEHSSLRVEVGAFS